MIASIPRRLLEELPLHPLRLVANPTALQELLLNSSPSSQLGRLCSSLSSLAHLRRIDTHKKGRTAVATSRLEVNLR